MHVKSSMYNNISENIISNICCQAVAFDAVVGVTVARKKRTGDAANPVPEEPGVAALVGLAGGNPRRARGGVGRVRVRVGASCGAGRVGLSGGAVVGEPLYARVADVVAAPPKPAREVADRW